MNSQQKSRRRSKPARPALTVLETPVLLGLRRQIVDLEAKLRLFAIYTSRDFVDAGGLMSYAADRRQQYRRAAELVAKILKGEKPAVALLGPRAMYRPEFAKCAKPDIGDFEWCVTPGIFEEDHSAASALATIG